MTTAKTPRVQARRVSAGLTGGEHTALVAAAKAAEISTARLTHVLISFGLDQLARGNRDLERAIKTSRDA